MRGCVVTLSRRIVISLPLPPQPLIDFSGHVPRVTAFVCKLSMVRSALASSFSVLMTSYRKLHDMGLWYLTCEDCDLFVLTTVHLLLVARDGAIVHGSAAFCPPLSMSGLLVHSQARLCLLTYKYGLYYFIQGFMLRYASAWMAIQRWTN